MQRQTTTETGNRQSAKSLLPDLLDRQMLELARLEEGVDNGAYTLEDAAERWSDYCQRMAAIVVDPKTPRKWFNLMSFLLGVSGKQTSAMVRRSKAAGNPPAQFELLVSYQVTEALLRGHVLAGRSPASD